MLRGGFIRQVMAGVYTSLPMGLRTMRKIEGVVREEMDAAGAQEIRMPILLPAEPVESRPAATTCTATSCSSSKIVTGGS